MLINLPHSSFTVGQYTTVKEVRLHSHRGKATVTRVAGIVASMPCCDMGVTAPVTSWVRAACVGSLALDRAKWHWRPSPRGVGRDGTRVRGPEGSGKTELAPEAQQGRTRRSLRPRPKGSGEPGPVPW